MVITSLDFLYVIVLILTLNAIETLSYITWLLLGYYHIYVTHNTIFLIENIAPV